MATMKKPTTAKKPVTAKSATKKTTTATKTGTSELSVSGNKKIETLRKEFNKKFPYLRLGISARCATPRRRATAITPVELTTRILLHRSMQSVRRTAARKVNGNKDFDRKTDNNIMSKEYYKKCIIYARANIAREREMKKKDNARIAAYIKSATSPAGKARYRKDKVDVAARHDANIERYKRQIESYKQSLKNSTTRGGMERKIGRMVTNAITGKKSRRK